MKEQLLERPVPRTTVLVQQYKPSASQPPIKSEPGNGASDDESDPHGTLPKQSTGPFAIIKPYPPCTNEDYVTPNRNDIELEEEQIEIIPLKMEPKQEYVIMQCPESLPPMNYNLHS